MTKHSPGAQRSLPALLYISYQLNWEDWVKTADLLALNLFKVSIILYH